MANLLKTKRGKNLLNILYGLGASIVIVGAWAKILHLSWADLALTVGLLTEAAIFAVSAFDFPDSGYDWSLVYPELAGGMTDRKKGLKSASQQLDEMLDKAKIGPELIDSLKNGFASLNDNVKKMGDISEASVATKEFASTAKTTTGHLSTLGTAAANAVSSISSMATGDDVNKQYHVQVQSLVKNLSQLNANYELENQNTSEHLTAMNKFYGSMSNSMQAMMSAEEDAKKYQTEISKLSKNLASLNSVYGNMLAAMNPQARV